MHNQHRLGLLDCLSNGMHATTWHVCFVCCVPCNAEEAARAMRASAWQGRGVCMDHLPVCGPTQGTVTYRNLPRQGGWCLCHNALAARHHQHTMAFIAFIRACQAAAPPPSPRSR